MIEAAEPSVLDELERIAKANGGVLRAEDVVESARNERSPLHASFTWDNDEAAERWRLHQARNLIWVSVQYLNVGESAMREEDEPLPF